MPPPSRRSDLKKTLSLSHLATCPLFFILSISLPAPRPYVPPGQGYVSIVLSSVPNPQPRAWHTVSVWEMTHHESNCERNDEARWLNTAVNKTQTADGKRKRAMWADIGAETQMKEVLETRGCLGEDCPRQSHSLCKGPGAEWA